MRRILPAVCVLLAAGLTGLGPSHASWERAKDVASDEIYAGVDRTFYCGCVYTSHADDDGSGDVSHDVCGYAPAATHEARAERLEWEHVVPASLTPASQMPCWTDPAGGRDICERGEPRAQAMLFDLHNLVPSIGQVNALRDNDRYADLDDPGGFGTCDIADTVDAFEPPTCKRGDVARIWFYMERRHGAWISPAERRMFTRWSAQDPVSP